VTIFSVTGGERAVQVRYIPVVTWAFGALAAYGVVDVCRRLIDGRLAPSVGSIGALLLLIGFALFVLYTGGQLVLASFDRADDSVRIRRYGLGGASRTERRLSELAGIDVRLLRRAQHRIELRFRSGERLPLTPYYIVSWNNGGVQRICALAGLQPTIVRGDPTPGQRGLQ
jgi:hypothetical protein